MFKKVIWATDGSEGADQAMPLAKALAAEGGGELLAVHCEEIMMPVRGTAGLSFAPNEEDLQAKIRQQVAELSQDGVTTTMQMTKSISGGAAHAIADVARDEHADLIVVGTPRPHSARRAPGRERDAEAAAHRTVPGAGCTQEGWPGQRLTSAPPLRGTTERQVGVTRRLSRDRLRTAPPGARA